MSVRILNNTRYRGKPHAVAKYLNEALLTKDTFLIMRAIRAMVHAQGMTRISRKSAISRNVISTVFESEESPSFDTVLKLLFALDIMLMAEPAAIMEGDAH
jgi:probable addiction module antidote protein